MNPVLLNFLWTDHRKFKRERKTILIIPILIIFLKDHVTLKNEVMDAENVFAIRKNNNKKHFIIYILK